MRLSFAIVALSALLPLASSAYTSAGAKSCKDGEFWWTEKECCLREGGPVVNPTPPKGNNCPSGHYWGENQGCCVPRQNPPSNPPPPQCPKNWTWYPSIHTCHPTPEPPAPPAPQPSKVYGHKRRGNQARTGLCPVNLEACPIRGSPVDYECLDVSTELESCGGCTSQGKGQDCTAIVGAWNVGCEQWNCVVYSCAAGFEIGIDGKSCVPI